MVIAGANLLQQKAEHVNALNVFPVPDGDTGTNMNLTMSAGVTELKRNPDESIGKLSVALSKSLLMGARGNSGVILSQLFRGFSRYAAPHDELTPLQFAAALQSGVDAAYKAVIKPVEGTILTVAKEAARHAVYYVRHTNDITELMDQIWNKAKETLAVTPEMLPVLKQVGVVDSGGQGLVYIYEGFLNVLKGTVDTQHNEDVFVPSSLSEKTLQCATPLSAQAQLSTNEIEFLYDMEFFIRRSRNDKGQNSDFDQHAFHIALSANGDSIIIIADDDTIKVHVHSKAPDDVLRLALQYGELTQIHILNMREQHRELLHENQNMHSVSLEDQSMSIKEIHSEPLSAVAPPELARFGFISVALGEGITDMFQSLGVDIVLSGGQTMNPSTEDFVKAVHSIAAEHIFILPNNSNIVLTAQQASQLLEGERAVTVIPSKTIPQGISAAFSFDKEGTAEMNEKSMMRAIDRVQSGQVTYAVRDTVLNDLEIKEGHYIGLHNSTIVATEDDMLHTCKNLLQHMITSGDEIITIFEGEQCDSQHTSDLIDWLQSQYAEIEVEVYPGGQPVYYYLFSVEA